MSYAGLDLSRQRLDVHVLDEDGSTVEVAAVHPDGDALRSLAGHIARHGQDVRGASANTGSSPRVADGSGSGRPGAATVSTTWHTSLVCPSFILLPLLGSEQRTWISTRYSGGSPRR